MDEFKLRERDVRRLEQEIEDMTKDKRQREELLQQIQQNIKAMRDEKERLSHDIRDLKTHLQDEKLQN